MNKKTAFFTGHRNISKNNIPKIKNILRKLLIELIKNDIIYYGNGGAYGFDLISSNIVLELKQQYPQIRLIMVLPCKSQTKYWSSDNILEYNRILSLADKIIYISEDYHSQCMQDRNKHMVQHSNYCISYCTQNKGGTFNTIKMSHNKGIKVYNLADFI